MCPTGRAGEIGRGITTLIGRALIDGTGSVTTITNLPGHVAPVEKVSFLLSGNPQSQTPRINRLSQKFPLLIASPPA